jgi:hypothetical protein
MPESILDASETELGGAQAKITFLGTQTKPVGTLTFSSEGHQVLMDRFIAFQAAGRPYANDGLPSTEHFSVNPAEFHRMLAAIRPILLEANTATGGVTLSFVLVVGAGGGEFRMNADIGRSFYPALIKSLDPGNDLGRTLLRKQFMKALPGGT